MPAKKPRRVWTKPLIRTARIEVKCSEQEKDAIYAAALAAQKPVTRFLVDTAMEKINSQKGRDHE